MNKGSDMDSASEPILTNVIFRLGPPFICMCEYVAIAGMAIMFLSSGWLLKILAMPLAFLGLITVPFWYKTFFDRDFVGLDRPLSVQWSYDGLRFRGAYFIVEVPVQNVLQYKVIGFKQRERAFMLKVKVRRTKGSVISFYLSTTMPRKKEFLSFLKEAV